MNFSMFIFYKSAFVSLVIRVVALITNTDFFLAELGLIEQLTISLECF